MRAILAVRFEGATAPSRPPDRAIDIGTHNAAMARRAAGSAE
jgi:hypothetical protein